MTLINCIDWYITSGAFIETSFHIQTYSRDSEKYRTIKLLLNRFLLCMSNKSSLSITKINRCEAEAIIWSNKDSNNLGWDTL